MMRVMMLTLVTVILALVAIPAQASVASDAGAAVLEFAKDTFIAPDVISTSIGDPWTLDFSRKVDVSKVPGLKDLQTYGGLSLASSGPTLRANAGLTITNVKGNRLFITIITAPYDEATWRIPLTSIARIGLEPRIGIGREF